MYYGKYILDTHALIWYLAGDPRIGSETKEIIQHGDAGKVQIILPAIVLIETISVISNPNKKINGVRPDIDNLFNWIESSPSFIVHELDIKTCKKFWEILDDIEDLHDDHDKLIVVTSIVFNSAPILTQAGDIKNVADVIW